MIFKKTISFLSVFLPVIIILYATACKQQAGLSAAKKYSIYILAKDGKEYIMEIDSLTGGITYPEKEGAALNIKDIDRDIIVKDNFYYRLNRKKAMFSKYGIANKSLIKIDSLLIKDFSIENYCWLGKDTLLLTGLKTPDFAKVKYVIINVKTMATVKEGNMNIAGPTGRFTSMSIGFVEPQGNGLLVGYTYHQQLGLSNYTTSDTTFITGLKYPGMEAVSTAKDTRSTYPGGINTVQSYAFKDEQADFYYMTCPGIALGNRPDLPTAIFRIKKGAVDTDKDYFFNISGSVINNHAYGLWYLGNHKAIIRSERKDLYKDLSDHYSTAHFEFYLLNLNTKTINKLALPLDKGTRRECVLVNKNIAYVAVNSTKEGNYIWLYDIGTGTLKKGLQLAGETDFIMRIDKLN